MKFSPPALPLPEPLRAAERHSFTYISVVQRLSEIARRTLDENPFPPETVARIQALIDEIPNGKVRPVSIPEAPYEAEWNRYIQPYEGMDWLQIPWFFAEEYFYVRILEATGYFHPGPWRRRDPYARQKRLGLECTREASRQLMEQVELARLKTAGRSAQQDGFEKLLEQLVLVNLWGNQNDLSMWPVELSGNGTAPKEPQEEGLLIDNKAPGAASGELTGSRHHIIVDDTPKLLAYLKEIPPEQTRVDILVDNAGYELVTDLALADFLLATGRAAQVTLHLKWHPVFVSDALSQDVFDTLDAMTFDTHTATHSAAIRLRTALVKHQLQLLQHPFWTSPLAGWEMPPDLIDRFQESSLLISKGDANYRRLLGDRHWPLDLPFEKVMSYMNCPVLALRTLKSEIAVGIDPGAVPGSDPDWMINGRWGLVQFACPQKGS
ncbi:MAG: protein-glutamate O-methyltransferase family protein [Chloroflexi bacterium]|nr:protein-glutamate O-methyltransferase family protein [Chloroflexota bacterium]